MYKLRDLVSTIENISNESQIFLKNILKDMLFRRKDPIKLKETPEFVEILSLGILEPCADGYTISPKAKKNIRKVYTYLIRKFDTVPYFDPETGSMADYPKGAEFTTIVSTDGKVIGSFRFPEDEVTEMLNLFGTNRCNK